MTRRWLWLVTAVVWLAGCPGPESSGGRGGGAGAGGGLTGAGGGGSTATGGGSGGGGTVPSTTYEIRDSTVWHSSAGAETVPGDPQGFITFQSFGGGSNQVIAPFETGAGLARYRAPTANVNYVQFGNITVMDPPTLLDMTEHFIGRRDVAIADAGAWADVQATQLLPFDPAGEIEFSCPNAGTFSLHQQRTAAVDAGSTAGTLVVGDDVPLGLCDFRKGDLAWVSQFLHGTLLTAQQDGGAGPPSLDVQVLANSARLDSLQLQAGGHVQTSGSFASENPTSFKLRLDTEAWRALRLATPTTLASVDEELDLAVSPLGSAIDVPDFAPDLLIATTSTAFDPGSITTLAVTAANPYPGSWPAFVQLTTRISLPPSTVVPGYSVKRLASSDVLVGQSPELLVQPTLSAPRNLTIEGKTAYDGMRLTSLTPHLAWNAPQVGLAHRYLVTVAQVISAQQAQVVARYFTTSTSQDVFTNVLKSGGTYVFTVFAQSAALSTPFIQSLPAASTPTMTPVLVAP